MSNRLVQVRHSGTGRKALMAESSLWRFPDYVLTTAQQRLDEARPAPSIGGTALQVVPPIDETAPAGKEN